MNLRSYLKRAGVISGSSTLNSASHSMLERQKRLLLGLELFKGGEQFLRFGSELHTQALEHISTVKLSKDESILINCMLKALRANKVFTALMLGAVVEVRLKIALYGVMFTYILDIHQKGKRIGADLKSTGCRCMSEFIHKAIEMGYFRQAYTYKLAAKLKEFYFIAATKQKNSKIFVIKAEDYPFEMDYAEQEFKFLTYITKHYGKINGKNSEQTTIGSGST